MGLLAFLYPVATAEPSGVLSICVKYKYRRDMSWDLSSGALFHISHGTLSIP